MRMGRVVVLRVKKVKMRVGRTMVLRVKKKSENESGKDNGCESRKDGDCESKNIKHESGNFVGENLDVPENENDQSEPEMQDEDDFLDKDYNFRNSSSDDDDDCLVRMWMQGLLGSVRCKSRTIYELNPKCSGTRSKGSMHSLFYFSDSPDRSTFISNSPGLIANSSTLPEPARPLLNPIWASWSHPGPAGVGDLVLKRVTGPDHGPLKPKWEGPYKISEVLPHGAYR
ncbi:holo-[acyl-carrier-protein] synthase [Striga asiatica]|uniref:Holo-[acyl-carrier-protein] synthase n=1 Tax=Striga asiatica TaxID=4170 RepID=A0A5A7PPX1_STRAF|nr:holo-[acyl-carrier-protein] synthase [Striga asiatica]